MCNSRNEWNSSGLYCTPSRSLPNWDLYDISWESSYNKKCRMQKKIAQVKSVFKLWNNLNSWLGNERIDKIKSNKEAQTLWADLDKYRSSPCFMVATQKDNINHIQQT